MGLILTDYTRSREMGHRRISSVFGKSRRNQRVIGAHVLAYGWRHRTL